MKKILRDGVFKIFLLLFAAKIGLIRGNGTQEESVIRTVNKDKMHTPLGSSLRRMLKAAPQARRRRLDKTPVLLLLTPSPAKLPCFVLKLLPSEG